MFDSIVEALAFVYAAKNLHIPFDLLVLSMLMMLLLLLMLLFGVVRLS